MIFFKKIISISLLSFAIFMCKAEDPFLKAIENCDDKKIAQMIYFYELLKNNKVKYKAKALEIFERYHYNNQSKLSLSNAFHCLKGLLYLGLAGISFIGAKEAYAGMLLVNNDSQGPNPKLAGLFGSIGLCLSMAGLSEISKIFTNYDNLLKYYKSLAIKESLSKIV